jgi:hypothetical protein
MLSERTDHAVAPEQQSERFDDGGLAAIIWADQNAVLAKPNSSGPNSAEILNAQISDLHGVYSLFLSRGPGWWT